MIKLSSRLALATTTRSSTSTVELAPTTVTKTMSIQTPTLASSLSLFPNIMATTITFPPGLQPTLGGAATQSALDIAASAIAPDGLGPLVPVYKLLYGFFKRHFHYDIASITKKLVLSVGVTLGIRCVWNFAKPLLSQHFTSSITLPVEHRKAKQIMRWLESQESSSARRHQLYTVTNYDYNIATQTDDLTGQKRTAMSDGLFWFEGRPLYFSFGKDSTKEHPTRASRGGQISAGNMLVVSGDTVTACALTESSGSLLERFTRHVAAEEIKEAKSTLTYTVGLHAYSPWVLRVKPVRLLDTIDLDAKVKADLISDVDRFFSPSRARWYGARGIPYKRGYMLSGPPGVGKSSLSVALAGHLGGKLYTIAMGQVRDESHLRQLLEAADNRSVLLLEDVDSAGIVRENMSGNTGSANNDDQMSTMNVQADPHADPPAAATAPITLSGLLNAIDGLKDGVLLIMTTNNPESLDKALIRPGRIDKQIYVGHASQAVAESIFKRLYSEDDEEHATSANDTARMANMAAQFAGKIPHCKLTPAEIQGFLIPLSDDPEQAIVRADAWVSELLAAKAAGKNIIGHVDEDGDSYGPLAAGKNTIGQVNEAEGEESDGHTSSTSSDPQDKDWMKVSGEV